MSAYDEVIAQRRAEQAQELVASGCPEGAEATNGIRFKATGLIAIGVLTCFTPLVAAGVVMVLVGIGLHLVSPLLQRAEDDMAHTTQTEVSEGTGDGCGAFLWACFVGAVLIALVTVGSGALVLMLMGGGQ